MKLNRNERMNEKTMLNRIKKLDLHYTLIRFKMAKKYKGQIHKAEAISVKVIKRIGL